VNGFPNQTRQTEVKQPSSTLSRSEEGTIFPHGLKRDDKSMKLYSSEQEETIIMQN
jgi:hypothetical protein